MTWNQERMTRLYDVVRAAQDLINVKHPEQPHEWRQHERAWIDLEAAVKRVVEHSENTRDTDTGC